MAGLRTGCGVVVVAVLLLLVVDVQSGNRSVSLTGTTAPPDNANGIEPMAFLTIIRPPGRNLSEW
jgi:ABC-type transporter Mla subunit MlaD